MATHVASPRRSRYMPPEAFHTLRCRRRFTYFAATTPPHFMPDGLRYFTAMMMIARRRLGPCVGLSDEAAARCRFISLELHLFISARRRIFSTLLCVARSIFGCLSSIFRATCRILRFNLRMGDGIPRDDGDAFEASFSSRDQGQPRALRRLAPMARLPEFDAARIYCREI